MHWVARIKKTTTVWSTTVYMKAPSKRPKTKTYERLLAATKDNLVISKLNFFSFVASYFDNPLTFFFSLTPHFSHLLMTISLK